MLQIPGDLYYDVVMDMAPKYYERLAAAYVRGVAAGHGGIELPRRLADKGLDELAGHEMREILAAGEAAGLKLYYFKKTHEGLPRVRRVLGFLKSIGMGNLLDVGSGRGVFLWPCLDAFPQLEVLGVDLLPHRVELLETVRRGGVNNLRAMEADICGLGLPDNSYDVVTLLEVLEHVPDVGAAVRAAVRIGRKYVVVTAPSKPDENPGHIHFLTKGALTGYFEEAGCTRLHFAGVPGHLIMVAALEEERKS